MSRALYPGSAPRPTVSSRRFHTLMLAEGHRRANPAAGSLDFAHGGGEPTGTDINDLRVHSQVNLGLALLPGRKVRQNRGQDADTDCVINSGGGAYSGNQLSERTRPSLRRPTSVNGTPNGHVAIVLHLLGSSSQGGEDLPCGRAQLRIQRILGVMSLWGKNKTKQNKTVFVV